MSTFHARPLPDGDIGPSRPCHPHIHAKIDGVVVESHACAPIGHIFQAEMRPRMQMEAMSSNEKEDGTSAPAEAKLKNTPNLQDLPKPQYSRTGLDSECAGHGNITRIRTMECCCMCEGTRAEPYQGRCKRQPCAKTRESMQVFCSLVRGKSTYGSSDLLSDTGHPDATNHHRSVFPSSTF